MLKIDFLNLNFQALEARASVLREGSKPLGYLRDSWRGSSFEKYLPEVSDYLPPEEVKDPSRLKAFIDSVSASHKSKMVRLCLPPNESYGGDYVGCVDVLPSKPAYDRQTLESIINHSLFKYAFETQKAQGIDPNDFIKWESGKDFNWDVGLLVQDYYGLSVGSLVEHPHEVGSYAIEMISMEGGFPSRSQAILSKVNGSLVFQRCQAPKLKNFFFELCDVYNAVKDSGAVPEDYSFQLEFGKVKEGIKLYQVRLFRKIEERANFDIEDISDLKQGKKFSTYNLFSFGITPKEGIEIPVTYLNEAGVNALKENANAGYVFGYPYGKDNHESPPLNVRPENIAFYHAKNDRNFLEHGHYRFGVRSDIFMVCAGGGGDSYPSENLHGTSPKVKNIKVYSNGLKGAVLLQE